MRIQKKINMNINIFFSCILCVNSLLVYSQKISNIDTLEYEKMVNKGNKSFKTGMDIGTYIAIDKNSYKVGDTLILGNPNGESKFRLSRKANYEYIFYGKPAGVLLKGIRYVEEDYKGYKVVIEKIQFNKGTFGLENYVFFYVKPLPNTKFTLIDRYVTITMVDNAITRGEIIPSKVSRPLTREEAIIYLKKKKEELDLGIISQEEFDKIKEQFIPIIKSGK